MKITTKDDNLIVQLEGVERLWAFKSGLNLKKDDIETINWSEERPRWRDIIAVRCPGTAVPKVLYAGNFISNRGLEFWYLQMREHGFLVMTLKNNTYKTIRLTTSQGVGLQLKRWLAEKNKPSKKTVKDKKSPTAISSKAKKVSKRISNKISSITTKKRAKK